MVGAFDGVRWQARTEYRTIAAGLDALRIHDGAARGVVRDFCAHVATDSDYRHAYHLGALPDEVELDFEGHLTWSKRLALWTTPR